MKKLIMSAAMLAAISTTSFAQESNNPFEGAYAGGMIGYNSYNFKGLGGNMSGLTFGGLIGYRNEISDGFLIGIEGYVQGNQANKDLIIGTVTVNSSPDESYGFNATAGFGSEKTLFFVLAGWGWNGMSASTQGISISDSDNGVHAGIGAEFVMSDSINLRVQGDWQDFRGANSIGASAGIIFKF